MCHCRLEWVLATLWLGSVGCSSSSPAGGGASGGSAAGSGGAHASGGATAIATGGTLGSGGSPVGMTGGSTAGGGATAAAGTGGVGAVASTGGQGGGGGASAATGACPANAIFCADFEAGTVPAAALFYPEYLRPMLPMYLTVDGTIAHGGTKSAKFSGTSFSQMLGVATHAATFWTRVYLRSTVDVATQTGHATYVAATDGNGDPNMGVQVRVGEHSCQLELNRSSDDKELLSNGGTYQCSGGIVFAKETWSCLETFYDGPNKEVRVFANGVESTAMHVTDWGPYTYSMFKFGFENYSSEMRTMWFDDVAIAPQRIGCQP